MLGWLAEVLGEIPDPLEFHGGFIASSAAVQVGWASLRQPMRSWGISRAEDLTIWLRTNGLPATQSGNHLCKGSRTHHDGSLQGGCQAGIARDSFRCPGLIERRQMGLLPMVSHQRVVQIKLKLIQKCGVQIVIRALDCLTPSGSRVRCFSDFRAPETIPCPNLRPYRAALTFTGARSRALPVRASGVVGARPPLRP